MAVSRFASLPEGLRPAPDVSEPSSLMTVERVNGTRVSAFQPIIFT